MEHITVSLQARSLTPSSIVLHRLLNSPSSERRISIKSQLRNNTFYGLEKADAIQIWLIQTYVVNYK